ncbi:MAG: DUF455 family protein [Labilithrix sp.]|nr:DUF455 family protein [Labilithrix sp.]MCW5815307.1 DUF455 family protein [Labilithrix sp.]
MRRPLRREAEVTVEAWARAYVESTDLAHKLAPPDPPEEWSVAPVPPLRLAAPGRPPELQVTARAEKTRGLNAPSGRARALHTFLHHELQAAELMLWALLAFPSTPRDFRAGLVRVALDEARHMRMYAARIEALGHRVGDFAVRDWFWERVPTCEDAASFCAVMGLGLESANLEHAATFADRFRAAGDDESARVQELVGLEEIAHVRFGVRWFTELTGGLDFATWSRCLPAPLTPLLMRGRPLARGARKKAGQSDAFLDALDAWEP